MFIATPLARSSSGHSVHREARAMLIDPVAEAPTQGLVCGRAVYSRVFDSRDWLVREPSDDVRTRRQLGGERHGLFS
jgi:hypothetical protein